MDYPIQEKSFFDSLMRYIENPCCGTSLDLQHKFFYLQMEEREREARMEKRIIEKVLARLSVSSDVVDAVQKVEELRRSIEDLGR